MPDRGPAVLKPLRVGISILRDDRGNPVRMANGEAEARRRAIIKDIKSITIEADHLREAVDHLARWSNV